MNRRSLAVPFAGFLYAACASVPAPVTRSPQSPAHPAAPEAVTPPLSPTLMTEPEPAFVPKSAEPNPHAGHAMPMAGEEAPATPAPGASTGGHAGHQEAGPGPAAPGSLKASYTCPMHSQVKSDKPGTCPICGMTLIKKKPEGPNR